MTGMIARPTRMDLFLLLVLGLMWGTSYAFIRLGVETLQTFTLIASRLLIGFTFLATVVVIAREPLPRIPKAYLHLLVMSVINIVIPFTLITYAEQSVDSSIAAIINGTVPLLVIVLAALTFHDEPITLNRLAGLIVGYTGVLVIMSPAFTGGAGEARNTLVGDLALIGSTVAYAIGAVYSRATLRGLGLRPMIAAVMQVGFAFVIVSILALAFERPLDVQWNSDALIAVLWLGLLGSGAAYLLNFRLLSRIGATATSQLAYLLPVVGIVTGAIMFGERVGTTGLIGTALVVGGVALVNSRYGARRLFGRRPAAEMSKKPTT
jgi:drug/metabolite transporter (DMT)-like permease